MIDYLMGIVTYKSNESIVLESNSIGYIIIVSNTLDYELNNKYKIYTYLSFNNESLNLYGFKSIAMKDLFLKMISVKGIGPKTAIGMLKNYDEERIINAIKNDDINFLKSLPNIGLKNAKQIILDLKDKLITTSIKNNNQLIEIRDTLKNLGFKTIDIDSVLKDLNSENYELKDYLKLALIKLNKRR